MRVVEPAAVRALRLDRAREIRAARQADRQAGRQAGTACRSSGDINPPRLLSVVRGRRQGRGSVYEPEIGEGEMPWLGKVRAREVSGLVILRFLVSSPFGLACPDAM